MMKVLPNDLQHFLEKVCKPPLLNIKRSCLQMGMANKRGILFMANLPERKLDKFIFGFADDETRSQIYLREMTTLSNALRTYKTVGPESEELVGG